MLLVGAGYWLFRLDWKRAFDGNGHIIRQYDRYCTLLDSTSSNEECHSLRGCTSAMGESYI